MRVERVPLRVSHGRRSLRLPGFDYARPGTYFVTVCVRDGEHLFGEVSGTQVRLNAAGRIARNCWVEIPTHYPGVTLDAFIVMPNHVHGMVILKGTTDPEGVGAQHAAPLHTAARRSAAIRDSVRVVPGSLEAIVRSFKSATAKRINEARNTPAATVWQRNYYDRVIRDGRELHRARRYILSNPDRWSEAGKD